MAEYKICKVPISHNYAISEFKEMLKKVFIQTGLEETPTVVMVANLHEEHVCAPMFPCYLLKADAGAPWRFTSGCVCLLAHRFSPLHSLCLSSQGPPAGSVCRHTAALSRQDSRAISILANQIEVISKTNHLLLELLPPSAPQMCTDVRTVYAGGAARVLGSSLSITMGGGAFLA